VNPPAIVLHRRPLQRTLPDEHFGVEGRRAWFDTVEEMQAILDNYRDGHNPRRLY